MRRLLLILLVLLFCCVPARAFSVDEASADLTTQMEGRDGCMVIYDVADRHTVLRFNPTRANVRCSPCSTFKVAAAVMALDRGIIRSAATPFKWDGVAHSRAEENRDQTAQSWLKDSVIWVTQVITRQIGMAGVKAYLQKFKYGNQDMSGGLTQAWLSLSLTISAEEQVTFLDRLVRGRLAVARAAQSKAVALLPTVALANGATISGKTGSSSMNGGLGWYVGVVTLTSGRQYVFACNFTDRAPGRTTGPGGFAAKAIAIRVLSTF